MEIRRFLLSEIPTDQIEPLITDSFFASPGFLNLWRLRGGVGVWWTAWMDKVLAAVLPGVEFGKGPLRRLYSTPNGCYGRLCFVPDIGEHDRKRIASEIMKAIAGSGYMKVFISDFYKCFEVSGGFRSEQCETRLVDISEPSWRPAQKKLRQNISRAEREGIVLERFDGKKHFAGFLKLVRLSEQRIGVRKKYSPEFFRALEELSWRDDRIRWVYSEHEEMPMASSIFLVEGDSLLHWHVYFDESLAHLQATKYIIFTTAQQSAADGVRYLNMGASPENAEGVHMFKEKWGGKLFRYNCHFKKSWLGRMV
ncbi:MAG: GNAT family N-acetyltransferase [Candidatus Zixiibacteriota bacterium]|nr:MAG: GNAT family N-acetyltransferase [candidate division Zixibacteria bacterium]